MLDFFFLNGNIFGKLRTFNLLNLIALFHTDSVCLKNKKLKKESHVY